MSNKENNRKRRGQKGMAIVMVLGVLAVSLIMVVHIMTVCEIISKESLVAVSRSQLRYRAESATDHAFWMHLTDRRLFSNRKLGESDESRVSNTDFEPWMADRRAHNLFESNCQAYINTVEKTIRVDKPDTFKANISADDTDLLEHVNDFLDVLGDYTDTDSLVKLNGKEADDYAEEGYPSMPRNGAMQFKEELYWIDGWQDVVMGEVTIVPPKGKSISASSTKPSFFSASPSEIRTLLDLSDSDLETVLEARDSWTQDSTPLADSLPADLYANIMSNFTFMESNIAQFTVSSATENGEIRVLMNTVREVDMSKSTIYADRQSQSFSIWSKIMY